MGGVRLGLAIETGQLDWGTHMPMYTSTEEQTGSQREGGWSPPPEDNLRSQRRECHLQRSLTDSAFSGRTVLR